MTISHNTKLDRFTSLRVGGPADQLIELTDGDDIIDVLHQHQGLQIWLLGYGTNCLISDQGLPGIVIINQAQSIEELSPTCLKASSGTDWDKLVQATIDRGLYGLEFTSGIPGGVGAAVAGNIAAYGQKVADSLVEVTLLDSRSGNLETWSTKQLDMNYRSSALQQPANRHLAVIDATFELSQQPTSDLAYDAALAVAKELNLAPDSLANRRQIILETRRRAGSLLTDKAKGPWTAGSFFKNPLIQADQVAAIISSDESNITKNQLLRQNLIHGGDSARVSAAHVLLAAGFQRGQTWGHVRLHPEHVLKIENTGQATAQEIYDVVQEIIATVQTKLAITLEPEVRLLGHFTQHV